MLAKFWLSPIRLARSTGFGSSELRQVERMATENEARFLEAWNDFFEN